MIAELYCIKCKKYQKITDAQKIILKNGRDATKAKCAICKTGLFRIGK